MNEVFISSSTGWGVICSRFISCMGGSVRRKALCCAGRNWTSNAISLGPRSVLGLPFLEEWHQHGDKVLGQTVGFCGVLLVSRVARVAKTDGASCQEAQVLRFAGDVKHPFHEARESRQIVRLRRDQF